MAEAKRCLITGGAGFIGSHIADVLIADGCQVCVLDNLSTGKKENLPSHIPIYEMDLLDDLTPLFQKEKPQIVFHHAAQISVSCSVREPEIDGKTNILGSIHLLEACRQFGVERVIYASSGAVYGEPELLPVREEDATFGLSPYGISKLIPERYLYYYRHQFGIEFAALRYANVYGPRQDPHGEAGAVSIFSEKLLAGQQTIIFGDGEQTRDFVFVKDVARANLLAMKANIDRSVFPAFNVSMQKQTTVNVLFDTIQKYTGTKQPKNHGPKREGDVLHACLSNEKINKYIGWEPEVELDEGIRETVQFFQAKRGCAK
ncbi:MAG: NAD-dependent epimerase/dehydratase family protein [Candidatus Omnitrophota bacterium]